MATTKKGKKTGKKKSGKKSTKKTTNRRTRNVSPLNRTTSEADKERDMSKSRTSTSSTTSSPAEKRVAETTSVAKDAMERLEKIQQDVAAPTRESSAKRSQTGTGNNPTPPEERLPTGPGTQTTAAADMAAGAISAARDHLIRQEETDKRLKSDPRYERDQEVFKMGQEGKLPLVPPSEAEVIAGAERAGVSEAVAEAIPKSPEEQIADDKKRLDEAKKKDEEISPTSKSDNTGRTTAGT